MANGIIAKSVLLKMMSHQKLIDFLAHILYYENEKSGIRRKGSKRHSLMGAFYHALLSTVKYSILGVFDRSDYCHVIKANEEK